MYTLAPDEKVTPVMLYTQTSVVRGETVTKQAVRVSTWFRTDGVPDYINLHNVQWVTVTGGTVKPMTLPETFVPLQTIVAFHIVPPAQEMVDYDESETNRVNSPLSFLMGMFHVNGKIRVSTQTDIRTSLIISHTQWLSIYDAVISSPYLPQMPPIQVPMLIVRPMQVSFIFQA
jgi:hypothetical protein